MATVGVKGLNHKHFRDWIKNRKSISREMIVKNANMGFALLDTVVFTA